MTENLDSPVTRQLHALEVNYEATRYRSIPTKKPSGLSKNCLQDKAGIPTELCAACCFAPVPTV
jgi:hypothetical protein